MSTQRPEKVGEPAWTSIRYGFLVILIGGLVLTGAQLVGGSIPGWTSTGPAFITVGAFGIAGGYIGRALSRRGE